MSNVPFFFCYKWLWIKTHKGPSDWSLTSPQLVPFHWRLHFLKNKITEDLHLVVYINYVLLVFLLWNFSWSFWNMGQSSKMNQQCWGIYLTITFLTSLWLLSGSCWSSLSVSIISFFSTVFFISHWGSLLRFSFFTCSPTSSSFLTETEYYIKCWNYRLGLYIPYLERIRQKQVQYF